MFSNDVGLYEVIMIEIMKRLPVKDLTRYMLVSTNWMSSITSSEFKRSHYDFFSKYYGVDVLACIRYGNYVDDDVNIIVKRDKVQQSNIGFFKVHNTILFARHPTIIGMNSGIVCCLYNNTSGGPNGWMFAVCNPKTNCIVRTQYPVISHKIGKLNISY